MNVIFTQTCTTGNTLKAKINLEVIIKHSSCETKGCKNNVRDFVTSFPLTMPYPQYLPFQALMQ